MSTPDLQLSTPPQPLLPGQPVRLELTVRNTGPEVERFDLEPAGPLAAWIALTEPEVRIWPGEAAAVSVTATLPTGPHPVAGPTVIGVLVHAADGSTTSVDAAAEVAPRPQVAVEAPVPHAIRSSRWARVHVTVGNPGNTPLTVGVAAQDREGRLEHTLRGAPPVVELPPGVAAVVPVVLRCTRLTWVGKAVPRDYTVTARSPAAEATSTGVLTQASVVPRWWILVVGVLVVLAIADQGGGRILAVLALLGLSVTLVVLVLRRLFAVVGRRTRP